ncbi:hypothetical protein KVR01_004594 [Diaporthe batatas]|uniref:uncharacterized protein n=1 Tax=Diaporthe batatas TaxID=748121 RepID=UPI001D03FBA3|nr:uncharacterized protein KVR01_004594 [Diaporthe batatas]KAG8166042.1 hypothetical protein KVR01_004594 [Diaporthe batatas]
MADDQPARVSHWRLVREPALVTREIVTHDWKGEGTADDPYLIDFIPNDPRNPINIPTGMRWLVAALNAFATLAMTFASSAYTSSVANLQQELGVSNETAFLGTSLFVLGFALGPLVWAPLSEAFGRRPVFLATYGAFVACNVAAALPDNIIVIVTFRGVAGALGSSALVNSGTVVADMFSLADRGRVSAVFSGAPFLGPVLGPIAGGFLSQSSGWKGVGVLIAGLTGALWMLYYFLVPETYAPVLLRLRAVLLTKTDPRGKVFQSRMDKAKGVKSTAELLRTSMVRPFLLLFSETIVSIMSLYMAIIFGAMYMMFAEFPIVFQKGFGLSPGFSGLAFLGIAIGMIFALVFILFQNKAYIKVAKASPGGRAPPETRLGPARIGAVMAPIGLAIFAVTNSPEFSFYIPVAATVPFGFGMVIIFLSLLNYLVDTYTVYAGSAIAAATAIRSIFGAVFPLFTRIMFEKLGVHGGAAVPAALAAVCIPFPFLFIRYGKQIREKAKFATEARALALKMMGQAKPEEKKPRPLSDGHGPTGNEEWQCYGRYCLGNCEIGTLYTSPTRTDRIMADYTLYLVTDSTPAILGDKDICDVVDRAIRGGVTIVQYRDKTSDTGDLVATARRLHAVTQRHGVPLLINDRVDVALAVGCEGVHLGQDDMDITTARKLLGSGKIIGITANTAEEAVTACEQGADYLGIGTVFSTQTKTNTKNVIGPDGLRQTLTTLLLQGHRGVPTVCIGGINASNIPQVMFRGSPCENPLDGVAVVSAIMAAEDPEAASALLLGLVRDAASRHTKWRTGGVWYATIEDMLEALVPAAIKAVHDQKPLSHNMTNLVVQNFAANVALAIGASPIMANYGEEAADLAKLGGALVINMGTVTPEGLENYKKALRAYNAAGRPVVFDPVGAGATAVRRAAVKSILSAGYIDVIKGNESEIKTVWASGNNSAGHTESQRGVDSSSTLSDQDKAHLVRALAAREQAVVVMTGKTDVISDGVRVVANQNGHEYLGMVTGTGCTLGTTISAFVAACPPGGDMLAYVVAGTLLFEIAAEQAAAEHSVRGPGTFVPAFLDALYRIRTATVAGDLGWLLAKKAEFVYVCDIQEKFRNAIHEFDKVVLTAQKVLRAAHALNIPIYTTTQNRARLGETVPELHKYLDPGSPLCRAHADKTAFSMFVPEVTGALGPAPAQVVLVGIESHICITQTALDARRAGHEVYVLADGVSSCNREEVPVALARLRAEGVVVTTSESWLYEFVGDAGRPEFKAVIGLVKDTSADTKRVLQALAPLQGASKI